MTDQEALAAIERICGDDFCEDMNMRDATGGLRKGNLKTAIRKLTAIYKISHSFVQSHTCFHVHADWRAEAEKSSKPDAPGQEGQ